MQDIYGVFPGSTDYSHDLVLSSGGRKYGLTFPNGANDLRPIPPSRQPASFALSQNSWHNGRGVEVYQPNQFAFYDNYNMWTTTPNKLHPQLLPRFATGMRDQEMNWPDDGDTFVWKALYTDASSSNYRYLDVSFTASATSARYRAYLILRRKVPAGVTSAPGTLTVEWCADNGGDPGTVSKTITKTYSDAPDVTSYILEFQPASTMSVTASTNYHIKIYGASTDGYNNCWEVLCDTSAAGLSSTDNSSWSATTFSPFYRIVDTPANQLLWVFPFKGAWYCVNSRAAGVASQLWIHGVRGRVTGVSNMTFTDTGAGQYGGTFPDMTGWKVAILKGTGDGQVRTIASNTGTVVTLTSAWDLNPDATSEYYCYHPTAAWREITGHGFGVVSNKPIYANGIMYFPQGDGDNIAIMHLDYTQTNDHAFDEEDTKNNHATFLATAIDRSDGPQMWRANNAATTGGNPNGKAVSAARGSISPSGTTLTWGTDVTYNTSIFTGDNTYNITGLYTYNNNIYVAKEDSKVYTIVNDVPTEIPYGTSNSPSLYNGIAACTGADRRFYLAANHDVLTISGSTATPTGLPTNLPSGRSGYVSDMVSVMGWLFVAFNGKGGTSSVMKYSLDTRTWSEQYRGHAVGRQIRSVAYETNPEVRPTLFWECGGDLMYQEFPLYGVRPVQDSGELYMWEGGIEFSTIDLLNTNPKHFSSLEVVVKGLVGEGATAHYGREVMFEYQLDNYIGTSTWTHGGALTQSPRSSIRIGQGSRHKIRIRLRIINNDPSDPPIVENVSLVLFERYKQIHEWMATIQIYDEEELAASELYDWLIEMVNSAEPVYVESPVPQLHGKHFALAIEPNMALENVSDESAEGIAQIVLSEVIDG